MVSFGFQMISNDFRDSETIAYLKSHTSLFAMISQLFG